MLYAILKPATVVLLRIWCRLRAIGAEHIPTAGPVLLAANHVSVLDPPVIGAAVPRPLHFLAKAELFRVPLLGGVIRRLNAHPVVREGSDAAALRLGLRLLREGQALLVFPEGTRGRPGRLGPGKAGAGMLATLGGAPVVPVYVQGTAQALPRGAWLPRPVRVTVACGPPLRFARERGKARYQEASDVIMAAIGRLKAEMEREASARPVLPVARDERDRTVQRARPAGQIQ